MRLHLSTDVGLRCLLFLAASDGEPVAAAEIAERFDLSTHHVRTICKSLVGHGWVEGRRGAGGGVRLAVAPEDLRVGDVVRALEPLDVVECFDPERDACALSPTCRLKRALGQAMNAFLEVLDGVTLAELARNRQLRQFVAAAG